MGNIRSILTKPLRTFNIERRTEKLLERNEKIPAPTFPSVKKQQELAKEISPNFMEEHYKKDQQLDQRLKEVYVTSQDAPEITQDSSRALPQERSQGEALEYGFYEPLNVPPGKCSLRQAMQFLQEHKENPEKSSPESIAEKYQLDKQVVDNIIKYFRILTLAIPDGSHEEKKYVQKPIDIRGPVKLELPVELKKYFKSKK